MFFNENKKQISIKIGDLGQSKQIDDEFLKTFVGTKFYFSPSDKVGALASCYLKWNRSLKKFVATNPI